MIDRGKRDILGVLVDVVDYEAALERLLSAAVDRRPYAATALAVHGVMSGARDHGHAGRLNSLDLVTPDGQPVRWALNRLHGASLPDRVAGPDLTRLLLQRMAAQGLRLYLYGSTQATLARLESRLAARHPALEVVGAEPSCFRSIDHDEAQRLARRIESSGAHLVLVGLGCPRQEVFIHEMRPHLSLPLVAVGAAFDFEAGTARRAPRLVQRAGLEWTWRLVREPGRLWRRYVLEGGRFAIRCLIVGVNGSRPEPVAPSEATRAPFPA